MKTEKTNKKKFVIKRLKEEIRESKRILNFLDNELNNYAKSKEDRAFCEGQIKAERFNINKLVALLGEFERML